MKLGLPLGEAGSRRGVDGILMRVFPGKQKDTLPRFADPPSREGYIASRFGGVVKRAAFRSTFSQPQPSSGRRSV